MGKDDHLGNIHNVEGNMENGLGNTHNGHNITSYVEGEGTHNHDTRLICGAVSSDVVAMRGMLSP